MRTLLLPLAGLGLVAVPACGAQQEINPDSVTERTVNATLPDLERQPAYRKWLKRPQLDSCGNYTLPTDWVHTRRPYRRCMERALATGRGAEVQVKIFTAEGDPVVSYFRVRRDGAVEAYRDSTKDRFGSQEWSYDRCPQLSAIFTLIC